MHAAAMTASNAVAAVAALGLEISGKAVRVWKVIARVTKGVREP
jgi:hypothetical protein